MNTPLHYQPGDVGPTGEFSWWKAVGVVLGVGSIAPPILWYLEVGPQHPWYVPLAMTAFLLVLGVGIYRGKGQGAFQTMVDAAADRVDEN